ncbi:MAG: glycosyltransferase [Candidatus Binatia bacterium]
MKHVKAAFSREAIRPFWWNVRALLEKTFGGPRPFGVNIAGHLSGEFGQAESARCFIRALQTTNIPYVLNNVVVSVHRNLDRTFQVFSDTNPYRVNLVHVTVDYARKFYKTRGWRYFRGRYNIGCWYWELPHFPRKWIPRFEPYQEIWVASEYCAENIGKVSPIPVIKMTYPLFLDEEKIVGDRARFWLPESSFMFLFFFDFYSAFDRKNPLGLIKAFQKAFSRNEDVVLVIKSINSHVDPERVIRLKEAARDLKVRFIHEHFTREEMLSLMATCHCFVSLHRSEGFGLGLAQAMYLGKPVIGTAWSGNMDFMNANNSFLVKYGLIEAAEGRWPYPQGSIWADPDIDHAAELMRLVYKNRELGSEVGRRASAEIKQKLKPARTGIEISRRLQEVVRDGVQAE